MRSSTGIEAVDEILELVPYFAETKRMSASLLSGGLTNINYLLKADREKFVVRRSGRNAIAVGIDRQAEAQAVRRASEAGISPETIAFLLPDGHSVTRFVDGAKQPDFEAAKQADHLERMATLLKRVHGLEPIVGSSDPYGDIRRWTEQADANGIRYSDRAASVFRKALAIGGQRAGRFPPVLCHNDPYFMNVLDVGDYLLVDWEYAGMGDPFFDLAGLAYLADEAGRDLVLRTYFGEPTDEDRRALDDMIVVFLAWNVAWSLVQIEISEIDHDYEQFAEGLLDLLP